MTLDEWAMKAKLGAILRQHPNLDALGFRGPEDNKAEPIDPAEFGVCCEWLSWVERRKLINRRIGDTDTLRQHIEEWSGKPVSSGALCAAVLCSGIRWKRAGDSPSIHIAITSNLPGADSGPNAK